MPMLANRSKNGAPQQGKGRQASKRLYQGTQRAEALHAVIRGGPDDAVYSSKSRVAAA